MSMKLDTFRNLSERLFDERLRLEFYYNEIKDCNRVISIGLREYNITLKDGRKLTNKDFMNSLDFNVKFKCEMDLRYVLDRRIY
jgi:hypothetical protein